MPHLIGISGNLGAGKTTLASILAWYYKSQIESRGGHVELFANYDLRGAQRLAKAEDWYKVADAHGSICVWDEAHRSFDSRRHSQAQNILATEILTFVRKMASIQIFVTPSINRIDTRIREILEVLMIVRKYGKRGVAIDFYDYQADFAGRFGKHLKTQYIPGFRVAQIHRYGLFDSHSFVSGFPLPKTEAAANKFMQELERAHDAARMREGLNHA